MRFIIDAHLPRQLVQVFTNLSYEAVPIQYLYIS